MISRETTYKIYKQNKNKIQKPVYLINYDKLENQIIEASSNGLNYTIYYGMVSNDDLVKLHNELHYVYNLPMIKKLSLGGLIQISGLVVYWENFK